ncbi:MAG TPA: tyrosine--tRNA ligase [Candidatus Paceibacterota bacterium]|nr:tyrosine--tRNA ligase [Candidatus Paceibacterota bacterium]
MKENEKTKLIDEILSRGVGELVDPDGLFRKKLETEPEKVVIKLGVDPNRPDIHLGHAVILRKLRQFQDLGCKVIFLIGDFTAQIGDPTGKSKIRPEVAYTEIKNNMKTYLEQVKLILRQEDKVFAWINNLEWFISITDLVFDENKKINIEEAKGKVITVSSNTFVGKAAEYDLMQRQKLFNKSVANITIRTFLSTLRHITHSRLIARDMFQKRIENGDELYMHEMMYPVLQGIDSYVIARIFGSCDLEVGGTDQHFNMLMGRDIMKINGIAPQAVISFELLEGLDGKEKMSKSLDNYIGVTDEPGDMYGKVMSIPDTLIEKYFELCTFTPLEEVKNIGKGIKDGSFHPKDVKMNLARQIVEIYHGKEKAEKAEELFVSTFQKGEVPEEMTEVKINENEKLPDALVREGVVSSKTDWRRLIEEGAVTNLNTGEKVIDPNLSVKKGDSFRIGKKRFIKISS